MIRRSVLVLGLLSLLFPQEVVGGATTLTVKNFEEATNGKSVFIKFYAPWCAHCRAMAEDWDRLADEYADHPIALLGSVDCTSDDGQPLCQDFDIQGFPTLVYGDPMSADTYDGGRDYDSLAAWAKKHITKPICSLHKVEHCSAAEKKLLEALSEKTDEELEATIMKVEARVKEEEKEFDAKVAVIQAQYDTLVQEFNKNLEIIKEEFHYKYVEQLLNIRQEQAASGDSSSDEEL